MIAFAQPHLAIWAIAVISIACVLWRPFGWPQAIWAMGGAVVLVATGLVSLGAAAGAIGRGGDVYLFLAGMMLLSETARQEGLFDRVAAMAVDHAGGSPRRLFLLIYIAGTLTTAFLSNDATAVVLTPAIYPAARKAGLEPLPYLFICAVIANAASFILPISNPANIVVYGDHPPALGPWLAAFALPSLASVVVTYFLLRWVEGRRLPARCLSAVEWAPLTRGGWAAVLGIAMTAIVLLTVSALDIPLGLPTCVMGVLTGAIASIWSRIPPRTILRGVSWQILFLVAGLFVIVESVSETGLIGILARSLQQAPRTTFDTTAWLSGTLIALGSNLTNNLPAGLIASSAIASAHLPRKLADALLLGVDLGPNLSVTGSLATILWLNAIRREGEDVGFWRFLRTGAVVMPPALAAALLTRLLFSF